MILCDTNIYLELFKGNEKVLEEIETIGFGNAALSDISIGEIYYGMRKGEDRKTMELINLFNGFTSLKRFQKCLLKSWPTNMDER